MMADPREAAAERYPGSPVRKDSGSLEFATDPRDAFVEGWKAHAALDYRTLGDIQTTVRKMKGDGVTRASILFVIDRVYVEHPDCVYRDDPIKEVNQTHG